MRCEYCETPREGEDTFVCVECIKSGTKNDIVAKLESLAGLDEAIGGSFIPVVCREAIEKIDQLKKEMFRWRSIAERIHELVFTDYEFVNDFDEVVIDIENEQAELQYHVDVCRDSGLVPSRVPFKRLGE